MKITAIPAVAIGLFATSYAFSQKAPDPFVAIFASTCMKHYYSQDQLREQLSSIKPLPPEMSSFFLQGKEGEAWPLVENGDRYALALRKDGICAVFADKADADFSQQAFKDLVSSAPAPMVATEITKNVGPNTGQLKSVSWEWSRPSDTVGLRFTLTTSKDPQTQVAAMASMSLEKKSN